MFHGRVFEYHIKWSITIQTAFLKIEPQNRYIYILPILYIYTMGTGVTTFADTAGSGMNYSKEDINKIRGKPDAERTEEERELLKAVEEFEANK